MHGGLIVVADDLGASDGKNAAILRGFETGLIDAASVLANGPAFDEAAASAAALAERVGIHLVLTEGEPLREEMRAVRRFCDEDGHFRPRPERPRALRLDASERRAVAREWRAQIERARAAGFVIPHLDSHHHVHTEPGLVAVALAVARELGIDRVRLARNWGPGMGPLNRAWKSVLNRRICRAGLAGTRWFGGVADFHYRRAQRPAAGAFEVMVHPLLAGGGAIEDEDAPGIPLARLLEGIRDIAESPQ